MKFQVNNNEGFGVDVECALTWTASPPEDEVTVLESLVKSWSMTGMFGLFGGYIHYLGDIKKEGLTMSWFVDMGSSNSNRAFNGLKIMLNSFNESSHDTPDWVEIENFVAGK